jgi:hypothetical protein
MLEALFLLIANDTSTGAPTSWAWDFGDPRPVQITPEPGPYLCRASGHLHGHADGQQCHPCLLYDARLRDSIRLVGASTRKRSRGGSRASPRATRCLSRGKGSLVARRRMAGPTASGSAAGSRECFRSSSSRWSAIAGAPSPVHAPARFCKITASTFQSHRPAACQTLQEPSSRQLPMLDPR